MAGREAAAVSSGSSPCGSKARGSFGARRAAGSTTTSAAENYRGPRDGYSHILAGGLGGWMLTYRFFRRWLALDEWRRRGTGPRRGRVSLRSVVLVKRE